MYNVTSGIYRSERDATKWMIITLVLVHESRVDANTRVGSPWMDHYLQKGDVFVSTVDVKTEMIDNLLVLR